MNHTTNIPAAKTIEQLIAEERESHRAYEAETRHGPYLIADLRAAFEAVEDKKDWKQSFCVSVPNDRLAITIAAVEFFHGVKPATAAGDETSLVCSIGYAG